MSNLDSVYDTMVELVPFDTQLSKSLEDKAEAQRFVELIESMIDTDANSKTFIELFHQIWNSTSHIYELFTHIVSVKLEKTYMEVKTHLTEWKQDLQEYELKQLIEKATWEEEQRIKEEQYEFQLIVANQVHVKEFMTKIYKKKAFIGSSQGAYHVGLTLWRDPRAPVDIEIPKQIGIAEVEVKWVECHLPAPKIWTVPIGDLKSDNHKKYGWLDIRTEEKYMGFTKTIHVNSHDYQAELDGSILRITAKKVYMPGGISDLMGRFSTFTVPLRIRTVVITCAYTDPLA
jgi:hypothetical protein